MSVSVCMCASVIKTNQACFVYIQGRSQDFCDVQALNETVVSLRHIAPNGGKCRRGSPPPSGGGFRGPPRKFFEKMRSYLRYFLWWHISAITCQIIMLTCQIIMLTCQIFMLTCQIFMLTCHLFPPQKSKHENVNMPS